MARESADLSTDFGLIVESKRIQHTSLINDMISHLTS